MAPMRRARPPAAMLLAAAVSFAFFCALADVARAASGPLVFGRAILSDPYGAASDYYGSAVAVSGNTIVVGSPNADVLGRADQGTATVYFDDGRGWAHEATLIASDGVAGDAFGTSVAISGDTIVVGAAGDDVGGGVDKGSAYVFVRSGPVWTQQAKLSSPVGDRFGQSVDIDGDTVVVGSPYSGAEYPDEGIVFVFRRSGTAWPEIKRLFSTNGYRNTALMGWSVAISGNIVVAGAPTDGVGLVYQTGTALAFEERADHTWGCTGIGMMWDWQNEAWAGYSVDISGNTVVVGVFQQDIGGNANQGEAWVYVRTPGAPEPWLRQQNLTADDAAAGDVFGRSVAVSGDTIVVGASADDVGANEGQGSAYLFTRTGGVWSQRDHFYADDGTAWDLFGVAAALDGDIAVVGSGCHDTGGDFDRGAAYAYALDRTAPETTLIPDPPANSTGWNRSPVALTLDAADEVSGVARTWYRFGTGGDFVEYDPADKPVVSADHVTTVQYYSEDVTGNVEATRTLEVWIDTTPPVTTIEGIPNGWVPDPVTATLTAGDDLSGIESGDATTAYWTNAGGWQTGTSVSVTAEGITTLLYRSRDAAGNLETSHRVDVKIDGVAPTTRAYPATVVRGRRARTSFRVNDALPSSGAAAVTLKVFRNTRLVTTLALPDTTPCNELASYAWRCRLARGKYTVKVYAVDLAGNAQTTVGKATLTVR